MDRKSALSIEELYCGCDKPRFEELGLRLKIDVDEHNNKGSELIRAKIIAATREMEQRKAEGADGIPVEILKMSTGIHKRERVYKHLERIRTKMYETGDGQKIFTKAMMIPL